MHTMHTSARSGTEGPALSYVSLDCHQHDRHDTTTPPHSASTVTRGNVGRIVLATVVTVALVCAVTVAYTIRSPPSESIVSAEAVDPVTEAEAVYSREGENEFVTSLVQSLGGSGAECVPTGDYSLYTRYQEHAVALYDHGDYTGMAKEASAMVSVVRAQLKGCEAKSFGKLCDKFVASMDVGVTRGTFAGLTTLFSNGVDIYDDLAKAAIEWKSHQWAESSRELAEAMMKMASLTSSCNNVPCAILDGIHAELELVTTDWDKCSSDVSSGFADMGNAVSDIVRSGHEAFERLDEEMDEIERWMELVDPYRRRRLGWFGGNDKDKAAKHTNDILVGDAKVEAMTAEEVQSVVVQQKDHSIFAGLRAFASSIAKIAAALKKCHIDAFVTMFMGLATLFESIIVGWIGETVKIILKGFNIYSIIYKIVQSWHNHNWKVIGILLAKLTALLVRR
eukprot:GFYU01001104.1.p1 GENE.GFYU01001104.1~~GFYU01001104.1.p1  ORF type:complete len:451 (-),score=145.24 GFYU01001104.1:122-1474(-)